MTRCCILFATLAFTALSPCASADSFRVTSTALEDPVTGDLVTITLTYSTPADRVVGDSVPDVACWNGITCGTASEVPAESLTFDFSGARGLGIDDIHSAVVVPDTFPSVGPISLPLPPAVWSGLAMIGSLAAFSRLRRR